MRGAGPCWKLLLLVAAAALNACGGSGSKDATDGTSREAQPVVFEASDLSIYEAPDDGSDTARLLVAGADYVANSENLSPDRKFLYTRVSNGSGGYDVAITNVKTAVTTQASHFTNPTSNLFIPAWNHAGDKFVVAADGDTEGVFEYYLFNADGSGQYKLPLGITVSVPASQGEDWSPDDRYFVKSLISSIKVYDVVNDTVTSISPGAPTGAAHLAQGAVHFSPDGNYIAYQNYEQSVGGDPAWQVYTVRPDGSDHELANGGLGGIAYISTFTWSPDSRFLEENVRHRTDTTYGGARVLIGFNTWNVTADTAGSRSKRVLTTSYLVGSAYMMRLGCYNYCQFHWLEGSGARMAYVSDHESYSLYGEENLTDVYVYDADTLVTRRVDRTGQPILAVNSILGGLGGSAFVFAAYSVKITGGYTGTNYFVGRIDAPAPTALSDRSMNTSLSFRAFNRSHDKFFAEYRDTTGGVGAYSLVVYRGDDPSKRITLRGPESNGIVSQGELHPSDDGSRLDYIRSQHVFSFDIGSKIETSLSGSITVDKIIG